MAYKNRTDIHRVGAIVPANYEHTLSYYTGGPSCPSIGVNCALRFPAGEWTGHLPSGRCCVLGLRATNAKFAEYGHVGKCTVCGAAFSEGDVWIHVETLEYIHIGHNCADKYELLTDRSSYELERDRATAARAVEILKAEKATARESFLAAHPGLEIALGTDHHIVRDIASRFTHFTTLSDKQVALVLKLHAEVSNPVPKAEEKHTPAPTGRVTFSGVVVSVKEYDGNWGVTQKITVKVTSQDGSSWLAWGTAPRGVLDTSQGNLRGSTVEITATLKPGRDAHFALMSRPSGRVIALPEVKVA